MASIFNFSSDNMNAYEIILDCSGSMDEHEKDVRRGIKAFMEKFKSFPEADSIAVAFSRFGDGYYPAEFEKVRDLTVKYRAQNEYTALYYAIVKGAEHFKSYIREVTARNGCEPIATFMILTDGHSEHDKDTFANAKETIDELRTAGINTIYIPFGGNASVEVGNKLGFELVTQIDDDIVEFMGETLSEAVQKQSRSCKALGAEFFSQAAKGIHSGGYSRTSAQIFEDDSWFDEI